jgi:hypothetical protein
VKSELASACQPIRASAFQNRHAHSLTSWAAPTRILQPQLPCSAPTTLTRSFVPCAATVRSFMSSSRSESVCACECLHNTHMLWTATLTNLAHSDRMTHTGRSCKPSSSRVMHCDHATLVLSWAISTVTHTHTRYRMPSLLECSACMRHLPFSLFVWPHPAHDSDAVHHVQRSIDRQHALHSRQLHASFRVLSPSVTSTHPHPPTRT